MVAHPEPERLRLRVPVGETEAFRAHLRGAPVDLVRYGLAGRWLVVKVTQAGDAQGDADVDVVALVVPRTAPARSPA